MKIFHVIPSLNQGGVEKNLVDLISGFSDQNYGTHYIISEGGIYEREMKKNNSNKNIHFIRMNAATKNPFYILFNILRIKSLIQKYQPDIVHVRSRAPAWSILGACRLTHTPMITSYHGTYSEKNKFKKFYNSVMLNGDRIIAISRYIHRHISSACENNDKIRIIHEGIDTNVFNPETIDIHAKNEMIKKLNLSGTKKVIGIIARITHWKGLHILCDAIKSMPRHNFEIVVVGSLAKKSPYTQHILNQFKDLNITHLEHIDDIPTFLSVIDILCSTSVQPEAFGRTMAEGLAMNKIVVASAHGGAIELCADCSNAYLYPPGNSQKLAELLQEIAEKKDIPRDSRLKIMEEYSLQSMVEQTKELYEETVSQYD
ncbi:MAG: hypothetical protein C0432_05215 [Candidatus Puniceispirillum sp.]|nr:hypothetical protein [Candidatus Pelagibacter sp.]MBA4283675.1 hypothetical protein [Candidatus Puniceispirillum sp.]